jgi:haloalkane dehalogenase
MVESRNDSHWRKRVRVLDTEMSFVDTGVGDPIVFLHGNPTSSFLWRNLIPYAEEFGRCLAPDLIGMGQSGGSPTHAYRFFDHARYLDAWFDHLELNRNIVLVLHDWGSALGFYWAFRHRQQIQAIVYMEAIVLPRTWDDFPNGRDAMFRALRSDQGEHLVLDENFFIEVVLPKSIIRKLSDDEMASYRAPFLNREARLPTLVWPRELRLTACRSTSSGSSNATVTGSPGGRTCPSFSSMPILGAQIVGRIRDFCRRWPNQQEVTVPGIHFIQEDSPDLIGAAIRTFVATIRRSRL